MTRNHVDTAIVGGGQAGLAMSRALTMRGIDHLVLEKGMIGNAWCTARWDSLRLLTPNWANGLPGRPYGGPSLHGFMSAREFAESLTRYASFIAAPLVENVCVHGACALPGGFELATSEGPISCRTLVAASGGAARPVVPAMATAVPKHVFQTDPGSYKRPSDLPDGGVLVVGASASGVQIARELQLSGRRVTLAVGTHVRLPRNYRGRDIEWWLDAIGALDESLDDVDDLTRVRRAPSPQLIGGTDPVDLTALNRLGVEIVGRLADIRGGRALFSGGLAHLCQAADLKLGRLLDRIDIWAAERSPGAALTPSTRPSATPLPTAPRLSLDFGSGEIASIVWATGFRPADDWFRDLPVFDRRGRLVHDGGVVTGAPGLYVLGLPFLRRRRSLQISGAGPDTRDIARHLDLHLRHSAAA
ncbi:NAD(P)-binding domain-containing protein [uncultured Roseobacter sp.]|uniref:NAD(P)-binding domain-containing protein n=1 Tax=uncultured Roseobacter sp. TaxID=114847 RepID=UPI00261A7D6C|nr:NAD(P)-binding domain-containing protein [uncultured Roseobacter sp.]